MHFLLSRRERKIKNKMIIRDNLQERKGNYINDITLDIPLALAYLQQGLSDIRSSLSLSLSPVCDNSRCTCRCNRRSDLLWCCGLKTIAEHFFLILNICTRVRSIDQLAYLMCLYVWFFFFTRAESEKCFLFLCEWWFFFLWMRWILTICQVGNIISKDSYIGMWKNKCFLRRKNNWYKCQINSFLSVLWTNQHLLPKNFQTLFLEV